MSLLFSILRAGHASGTHHKLALDALYNLGGAYCESWQRLILKHAALYLEGSKAPDNEFKDFKNHVLHVRDGNWGGAPAKAANWYQHLLGALRDGNWSEAAYCAGVLSHYYTDPIHPFHTGQSVAENNIHRAVEWSISRSYDALAEVGARALPKLEIELGAGDDWLEELIIAGATKANARYEALLTHYDFHRGVVDPPAGLDQTAQAFVGELIQYAVLSFALVLQRAFKESGIVPPDVGLTAETVLATLKLPIKAILKRIDDKETRRQVEAMYDELKATGRVEQSMPEDERILQALHAKEVLNRAKTGAHDAKGAMASSKAQPASERRPIVPHVQSSAAATASPPISVPPITSRAAQPAPPPAPPVSDIPAARPASVVPAIAAPVRSLEAGSAGITPPLAAAAATAAASALSGLGGTSLASRLRPVSTRPTEWDAPDTGGSDTGGSDTGGPASGAPDTENADAETRDVSADDGESAAGEVSAAQSSDRPEDALSTLPPQAHDTEPAQADVVNEEAALPLPAPRPGPTATVVPAVPASAPASADGDERRCYLTPEHDIVDAPSIGPKTAERLKSAGILTVADLFDADPGALAETLNVGHIRAKTVAEWQDQARLVCEIPGLRGTHAQLLVGAGYRDVGRIARAEPREVSTSLLRYIQTSDGQRILRSGGAPDIEKIMSWVKAAERVLAAKAA